MLPFKQLVGMRSCVPKSFKDTHMYLLPPPPPVLPTQPPPFIPPLDNFRVNSPHFFHASNLLEFLLTRYLTGCWRQTHASILRNSGSFQNPLDDNNTILNKTQSINSKLKNHVSLTFAPQANQSVGLKRPRNVDS